jgi:hypothetical protein
MVADGDWHMRPSSRTRGQTLPTGGEPVDLTPPKPKRAGEAMAGVHSEPVRAVGLNRADETRANSGTSSDLLTSNRRTLPGIYKHETY